MPLFFITDYGMGSDDELVKFLFQICPTAILSMVERGGYYVQEDVSWIQNCQEILLNKIGTHMIG